MSNSIADQLKERAEMGWRDRYEVLAAENARLKADLKSATKTIKNIVEKIGLVKLIQNTSSNKLLAIPKIASSVFEIINNPVMKAELEQSVIELKELYNKNEELLDE